ncbi:hypothetical protein ANO11243_073440 [Dothideomycetidae sp. 11243]|nr:hypothetical protein ANO11243_073440 [fungal sp. No.11243]
MMSKTTTSSPPLVTWNILFADGNIDYSDLRQTLSASIIGADPTATTLYFTCLPKNPDGFNNACPMANATMTIGRRAPVLKPHSITTGTIDFFQVTTYQQFLYSATVDEADGFPPSSIATGTFSIHCDVNVTTYDSDFSTVSVHPCTTFSHNNYGGPETWLKPTYTMTDPEFFTIAPQVIALTAGVEKLTAATATPSNGGASSHLPYIAFQGIGLLWFVVAILLQ